MSLGHGNTTTTSTRAASSLFASTTQKADPNRVIRVWRANNYPKQIWYMLGIAIFLLALTNAVRQLRAWHVLRKYKSSLAKNLGHDQPATLGSQPSWTRFPSAVVNIIRIILYRFTFPLGGGKVVNLAEVGLVCGYIAAVFLWDFLNTMNITTKEKLNANFYSNRAGNIAIYQYPFMVLLTGKNNMISWITGISYEKLNLLHRVSTRMGFILILVHTFGRIKVGLTGSDTINQGWMLVGTVATFTYLVVFILGLRPIRTNFYELFVVVHFVFVLFTLIASYYHTKYGHGFQNILIPTFVFWGFDRLARTLSILWYARPISNSASNQVSLKARARILPRPAGMGDSVRLTLQRRMTWQAGQTVLLSVPSVSTLTPFEAHPFTIANIPGDVSLSRGIIGSGGNEKQGENEDTIVDGVNDLVFIIKAKQGFTKRLRDAVLNGTGNDARELEMNVLLSGPYGSPLTSREQGVYERIVLVGGGSGVTYILPILQDVIRNVQSGSSRTRDILFLWAVPYKAQFDWVASALLYALRTAPSHLRVRIQLHATRTLGGSKLSIPGSNHNSDVEKEPSTPNSEMEINNELLNAPGITVNSQRPDVKRILAEEVEATSTTGGICVHVAGPATLADDVRASLRFDVAGPGKIIRGGTSVKLYVETYGLA